MKKLAVSLLSLLMCATAFAQLSKNMVQRSHLPFPGLQLSNICGYVDSLGNEYALVGTSVGMTIVDVTNPDSVFSVISFPGPNSIWREIKTWQQYAYVTTEGGGGLQIIDMRNLPGTNLPYKNWTPTIASQQLGSIHALHVDNAFVYLYGSNISNGGVVMGDLSDPWNPTFAGLFDDTYVHDGYVRNDTIWAGEILDGQFAAIDVTNKSLPVVVGFQQTPNAFTHNTWLSDNSKYLFATDEVDNSYLSAYDVSDVNSIVFLDKIQSEYPGSHSIVHNTHIRNDYAITSWYRDGVVITDCHRPQNLVNIGYIDDSPLSGPGYGGVWGAFPFFPSGTIVTSDMDSGLYVYTPNYVRACYLEGIVRDSICNTLLNNVHVQLTGVSILDSTDFAGNYKTGVADSGSYTAVFSKPGYASRSFLVTLTNGVVTNLDVQLFDNNSVLYTGNINTPVVGNGIPNAIIQLSGAIGYSIVTDTAGNFSNCLEAGQYSVSVGSWGYGDSCFDTLISNQNNNLNVTLTKGYLDDFSIDYGWNINSTTSFGVWSRATPSATLFGGIPANPGSDAGNDCSGKAFVTGNSGSGTSTFDNVNFGHNILTSPTFDLTGYTQPYLNYARWFFDGGTNGNDTMHISISNGSTSVEVETITVGTLPMSAWVNKSFALNGLIAATSTMKLQISITDVAPSHIVEGGFDLFQISEGPLGTAGALTDAAEFEFSIYPNPSAGEFTLVGSSSSLNNAVTFELTDVSGRLLEKIKLEKGQKIEFGKNLSQGVYFINSVQNGKARSQKLVKL